MDKKKRTTTIIVLAIILVIDTALMFLVTTGAKQETIREAMNDAVLHNRNQISLFGIIDVNPALISAYIVTAAILILAIVIRVFFFPKFTMVPGKVQLLVEEWVALFRNLAISNSPHRNKLLGGYIFAAGTYIFLGTLFELLGVQAITTSGHPISLPAPMADVNGAIMMGCLSYLFIMSGGIAGNKVKGVFLTLKEFSLPISMSFRLFGALLSGLLVTELVYYYINLSFILPVIVAVLFTLMHALIQAYVLTMLTSVYYGEVSEVSHKKPKKKKAKNGENVSEENVSEENAEVQAQA